MGTPIVILAGQSNAGRISSEVVDALDTAYGAGNYVLVKAWASGAPLTSARDGKDDWETPGELRTRIVDDTASALRATPDGYVAGIIWVQGEGDTDSSGTPSDYVADFRALFAEVRAGVAAQLPGRATGIDTAPIVISGLSSNAPAAATRQHWGAIQSELIRLGAEDPGIVTVSPDALATAAGLAGSQMFTDGLHYSDAASIALAEGLVAALRTLTAIGSAGADRLVGTPGSDVFVVDHPGDTIIEPENGGIDLVQSSISFSLRDYGLVLENLTLTGRGNINGTGNGVNNILTGNAGNNLLNGAWGDDVLYGMAGDDTLQDTRGNDTLVGGPGNDVYHVDSELDVVIERAGEGHDLIHSSVSFRLWADAPEVEDLILTGSAAIDGIGNGLDNRLIGNGAANRLDGARGRDWLEGGGGDDTLIGQAGADTLLGGAGDDQLHGDQVGGATMTYACGQAFRLYQATLDRAPDAKGFYYWSEQLQAGANFFDVVGGFVTSPEFRAVYGPLSDADFVELLYNNVLDRASDASGKTVWMGHLANGQSREYVVTHFAESPEFRAMTAGTQEAWIRARGVDDILDPGAGNSTLTGGEMSDTFVFRPDSDGRHVVQDFECWDTLDLRGFGYADVSEARAHFLQTGNDLVFADEGVTVVLQGTTMTEVSDLALMV
ncbi:DUF4214 domain-containing protein [Maliponia aquimaris]|uniref:Bifunctional hemolysin/adenylate cyclase n=1 Tax=Maliponia aquimaris TaxID=1673631 RepID=A0A238K0A5_9RHOB|nr:DUF4214 domain-containing protein [Maliponia aquimaris]SMX35814.1 Bifunctional hemolysin/adenylate cyclase precursor [Maliponia aquimaris]